MSNNKLSFKVDISDISKVDGSIELSIRIKFLYSSYDCSYNDKLWFDEDNIKNFIQNLSLGQDCSLTDIDSDFILTISANKIKITVHKKDSYTKDNLGIIFEMSLDDNLTVIKNEFEKLCL